MAKQKEKKKFKKIVKWNWEWQWGNYGIFVMLFIYHAIYPNPSLKWQEAIIVISITYIIAVLVVTLMISYFEREIIWEEV